jgi:hypothetical protein
MHAENLGSVFRTVLLSLRTLLIWSANLAVYYSHLSPGVGERWDNLASPVELLGFVFLLTGTMLYAQGSSAVVRHAAEVIADVQVIGQAVRQMSAMSAQSLESVWTGLAQRPRTPRATTCGSPAPATFTQSIFTQSSQAMHELGPHSPTSLNGAAVPAASPLAPAPPVLAAHELTEPLLPVPVPLQSPASLSYMSGRVGHSDGSPAVGSVHVHRPSFTEDVQSVVASGIFDFALSTSVRESIAAAPWSPPAHSGSAHSERHSAFTRTSFESPYGDAGVTARLRFCVQT